MTSHSCTAEREKESGRNGIAVTYPNPDWCKEAEANINERLQARYIFMVSTPQLRHYGHQRNVVNHQPALWLHLCLFLFSLSFSLSNLLSFRRTVHPCLDSYFLRSSSSQPTEFLFVPRSPLTVSLSLVPTVYAISTHPRGSLSTWRDFCRGTVEARGIYARYFRPLTSQTTTE